MMTTNDFVDDYKHLKNRYNSLKYTVDNWDNAIGKPNCPKDLLECQLDAMYNLLKIMETRADIEGIAL